MYIYIHIYDHIFDKTLKKSKSSEQYDYLHGKTAASFPHEFFLKDFRYLWHKYLDKVKTISGKIISIFFQVF